MTNHATKDLITVTIESKMADFVQRIFHIRGHPGADGDENNLREEIIQHADQLELTGKLVSSQEHTKDELETLFEGARDGDVFIYDGHGSEDGCIFLKDNVPLNGTELRAIVHSTTAQVQVYLNTCFSSLVAAHGMGGDYLRGIIATVLSHHPSTSENVTAEVDRYLNLVHQGGDDGDDLALRVAGAITSVGLDRFATIFPDRIAPVSIGSMNVDPDPILAAIVAN